MRILSRQRHRREAAEIRAAVRTPVHPAHERWLKYRAFGPGCRPYLVLPFTRGPAAVMLLMDDPAPGPAWEFTDEARAAADWWADIDREGS